MAFIRSGGGGSGVVGWGNIAKLATAGDFGVHRAEREQGADHRHVVGAREGTAAVEAEALVDILNAGLGALAEVATLHQSAAATVVRCRVQTLAALEIHLIAEALPLDDATQAGGEVHVQARNRAATSLHDDEVVDINITRGFALSVSFSDHLFASVTQR